MDTAEPTSFERPDEKVLLVWRLSNLIGYAIFTGVVFLVLMGIIIAGKYSWAILLLLALPLALWGFSMTVLRKQWENWVFRVTPEALEMAHGWLWKQRRIVARDRIQHVDINSGPFDRKFGVVQVVIHTAGTSVGMIPGLAPERAERLRDELMVGRGQE